LITLPLESAAQKKGLLPNLKKGEQQPFLLFELNILRLDKKSWNCFYRHR